MNLWLVGRENGKWWCCNRSPYPALARVDAYKMALESAHSEAKLLMDKHPIMRDLSRGRVVQLPGMPMPVFDAPFCIDLSITRETPDQVWVIEAPTRYQALKIARLDWEGTLLGSS